MGCLVLVRHGQSEWNAKNLFTGWRDPDLTEKGVEEALGAGNALLKAGFVFDVAFTSDLVRAQKTCGLILDVLNLTGLEVCRDKALNERDYGDLAGLNKDGAREKWGAEQVHVWRRSYDVPPPGGESLKDTAGRVLPYYDAQIKPRLLAGQTVLVAAHGNSLRALVMMLEHLSPDEILQREIGTGEPIVYDIAADGEATPKPL